MQMQGKSIILDSLAFKLAVHFIELDRIIENIKSLL